MTSSAYSPAQFRPLTFHDAAPKFASGADTPRAYLERCLETIAQREPAVQGWVVLNEAGAREAADLSTGRWRTGKTLSPIDGVPMGIKDLFETRDMPTEMGCAAYRGNFPKRDNAAVQALREAGAVILGKTVTSELGGSHPGPTTNPFDPMRTPGGSSSGTAAAIGARMVPAAMGSQVGGSIMRPSSFCANVSLKPTQGAINRGERQTTSMSTHGVHAGCIEDMWQISIEVAQRAGGDPGHFSLMGPDRPPPANRPTTLAVMETAGWDRLDDLAQAALLQVVDRIRAAGVTVLRRGDHPWIDDFERGIEDAQPMADAITAWENHWHHQNLIARDPDGVSARTKGVVAAASGLTVEDYRRWTVRRHAVRRQHEALAPVIDAFIAPSSLGPAPLWSGDVPGQPLPRRPTGDSIFNMPGSVLGAPCVNMPLTAIQGMPMGIQLMGQQHADARITGFARWILETIKPVSI